MSRAVFAIPSSDLDSGNEYLAFSGRPSAAISLLYQS